MSVKVELRAFEVRADEQGMIAGVVIPYGQASVIVGAFEETFMPGSVRFDSVLVNRQHERSMPLARLGHGLQLHDSANELRAEVRMPDTTDGRDTLELVRAGVLTGLSAEFYVKREEWPTDTKRIIHEAQLRAIGIVDDPAHAGAVIDEVRARASRRNQALRIWRAIA